VTHVAPAPEPLPSPELVPLLEVTDLYKHFPIYSGGLIRRQIGEVQAVSGVSFDLAPGETLGLVGESGCGKSTLGRSVLQLLAPTSGSVRLQGLELTELTPSELRKVRRDLQIVFQDPFASLNPRMPVSSIVSEPLRIHDRWDGEGKARVEELLETVGLNPEHQNRYPHEFSGGQRQRIGIARALALEPSVIVLDEPVSALDVSIQAGVVNLLEELQDRLDLSYLFVAHDLSVVRHISDRVAVMYLGKIVEIGTRAQVYERSGHPYTQALLSAVPVPDPRAERARQRILLEGDVPSPADPPSGCRFRTRCPKAAEICAEEEPALVVRPGLDHPVACHFAEVVTTAPVAAPGRASAAEPASAAGGADVDVAVPGIGPTRGPDEVPALAPSRVRPPRTGLERVSDAVKALPPIAWLALFAAITPFVFDWIDRGLRQTWDGTVLSCRSYDLYDLAAGALAIGAALAMAAGSRHHRGQARWRLPLAVVVVALSAFHIQQAVTTNPECPPVGAETEPLG
jgi:oligopeptide/dipeptide ABC transporter ATP-binding protein